MIHKRTWIIGLLAVLGLVFGTWGASAWAAWPTSPSLAAPPPPQSIQPQVVGKAVQADVSPPLRSIRAYPPTFMFNRFAPDNPPLPDSGQHNRSGPDSVLQQALGSLAMPTPIANFEGLFNYWGGIPPDTTGDVGPNHYIQQVNVGFQIFNKSGVSLYGPANFNTLFSGFGGACESQNNGDPVTLYDQLADRWIMTQFGFLSTASNTFECIAISTSPDPLGSYYRYAFTNGLNVFEDYPHLGVWPDGYYMSTNEFAGGTANIGAGFFAFERAKMIAGDPSAAFIYFNRPAPNGGFLPSDLDGFTPPPAGSPNFFLEPFRQTANSLHEYKFQVVNWNPPAGTLTGPFVIPVAPWDDNLCGAARQQCIPQPAPGTTLEAVADRFMHRLAYRNMGSYETLVVNHTVDSNAPAGRAGIRWYEIRDPNNPVAPTLFQQGTYAPADSLHRWMGSMAMDRMGDIALGFSASSTTQFPSINYTGRLVGDPLGQLPQGEAVLIAGGGAQTEALAGRWGDYSSLNLDPDECTFWYTQEYYAVSGLRNWRTRIGSFRFPSCVGTTPTPAASATGTPPTATRTPLPTGTPCAGGQTIQGAINNADPTMVGRLARTGVVSTCSAPKVCPGAGDMVTRHYDSYTYANTSGSSQCVTVSVTNNCGDNALLSATYLDSFDPNNVCTNYLADMGASGPTFSYSFSVPVGATYIVTVLENSANVGCAAYSLTVNPCTIPTPTGTPPTATITRTATPTPSRTGTATATPCGLTTLFNETFESGTLGLFTATTITGTMPWAADNTVHHTGLWSAHVVDPAEASDQRLSMTNAVAIPTVASNAQMQFYHRYGFEDNMVPYDGGVLEYSTDGGGTWTDAGALITEGGYTGVLLAGGGNPLELRQAWTNRSPGYPAFTRVTVNLNTLRGQNVQFRFREGSDSGTGSDGWWVDDVTINAVLACVTGTITVGPTATRTGTTVPTVTGTPPTATRTSTVAPTVTGTPPTATQTTTPGAATSTPTVCPVQFSDVDQTNPFYVYVHCLACRGIISGYGDGTFRPYATVTRGQVAKIVANSAAINDPIPSNQQTFNDVPSSNAFWVYIERLAARGIISGYADGTFRPFNPVTRGQLAKIDVNAAGYNDPISGQTFADVSPSDPFYIFVERAALHGVISGYGCNNVSINPCTGQVEVCDAQNRPYFRTCATATRGQTAKIVANTFYPNCVVRTTGGKP